MQHRKIMGLVAMLLYGVNCYADNANPVPQAVPTAPLSTVNTPSLTPAMPVSKSSKPVKPQLSTPDAKNVVGPPATFATPANTPTPPTPVPTNVPTAATTQIPPSNIVPLPENSTSAPAQGKPSP